MSFETLLKRLVSQEESVFKGLSVCAVCKKEQDVLLICKRGTESFVVMKHLLKH